MKREVDSPGMVRNERVVDTQDYLINDVDTKYVDTNDVGYLMRGYILRCLFLAQDDVGNGKNVNHNMVYGFMGWRCLIDMGDGHVDSVVELFLWCIDVSFMIR